jgi:hypothetical protein
MSRRARARSPGRRQSLQDRELDPNADGSNDAEATADGVTIEKLGSLIDRLLLPVVICLWVAELFIPSSSLCAWCVGCFLVAMLGYLVEVVYVNTLGVRLVAGSIVHHCVVVLFVIPQLLGVTVILFVILALCTFALFWAPSSFCSLQKQHSFFCSPQNLVFMRRFCSLQSETNLKAVLEKQNLGQTVSVLLKEKCYDSESLRNLNDSDIDTLVRRDELPSSTGKQLKSKKAQVITELTNMELFDAIRSDASVDVRLDLVRDKVKQGADVNATNEDGWPALMSACVHGHVEVAEHLVYKGADKHPNIHLKLDACKLWMIVVKGKDWPFLSESPFDVVLSHFRSGTSSSGNQRSKDAFAFVKKCLSAVESHQKKENWYCKARERSALEWKLLESWQVVFDLVLMPLVVRVLPQTSQPKSGFKGFEFECIWKRESNPDFESELGVYYHERRVSQTKENGELMIAVMKSIDSLYVRVRVFVFVCGWVIVCVWVIVFCVVFVCSIPLGEIRGEPESGPEMGDCVRRFIHIVHNACICGLYVFYVFCCACLYICVFYVSQNDDPWFVVCSWFYLIGDFSRASFLVQLHPISNNVLTHSPHVPLASHA